MHGLSGAGGTPLILMKAPSCGHSTSSSLGAVCKPFHRREPDAILHPVVFKIFRIQAQSLRKRIRCSNWESSNFTCVVLLEFVVHGADNPGINGAAIKRTRKRTDTVVGPSARHGYQATGVDSPDDH